MSTVFSWSPTRFPSLFSLPIPYKIEILIYIISFFPFFGFRFSFGCFKSSFAFFNQTPAESLQVVSSSEQVHTVSVDDYVILVEHVPYPVRKHFLHQQLVRLQKINSRDPPSKRSVGQIWFPPPATLHAACSVDIPASNCLCLESEPPSALRDVAESSTQIDVHVNKALGDWCFLLTEFISVDRQQQASEEALCEVQTYFDLHDASANELAELRATIANLQA